jgi:hypothetical protein
MLCTPNHKPRWQLLLSTALLCNACVTCFANADENLAVFVQRAVQVLDSPQLSQRQAAERALINKGPAILDLLPSQTEQLSAEVKKRLRRIRQTLYGQIAKSTTRASNVTLQGSYSLVEILREFESQTSNQVTFQHAQTTKVNLDIQETPFLQALDIVLNKTNLVDHPSMSPNRNQIFIGPAYSTAPPNRKHVTYAGIFRIAATKLTVAQQSRLTFQISWEPRIRPLHLTIDGKSISAIDDQQTKIKCHLSGERTLNVEGTTSSVKIEIPLELPHQEATKLTSVAGTLTAVLPGRHEPFSFSLTPKTPATPTTQRRAGVIVDLQQAVASKEQVHVQVKITYADAGDAFASHRGWLHHNAAYLSIDGQRVLGTPNRQTLQQTAQSVTYLIGFDCTAPLTKLTFHYHTPALLLHKQIDFEIHDIPLP